MYRNLGNPLLGCGALLISAAALGAQATLVLPAGPGVSGDLAKREGNTGFHLPAGRAPSRVLCVYRGGGIQLPPQGFTIRSIAFRRDAGRTGSFRYHSWKLSIAISSKGVPSPSLLDPTSFDRNHGSDRRLVLNAKQVQWPAIGRPPSPPGPFAVSIKLDAPFVWTGGNLCLDFRSDPAAGTKASAYWYTDAENFTWSAGSGARSPLGRGCPFGYQVWAKLPPLDGEAHQVFYAYTRVSAARGRPAVLALGVSDTSFGQVPLPLDLTGLGAPGCKLQVGPVLQFPSLTIPGDARGTVVHDLGPLPAASGLAGGVFYAQSFVVDPGANRLGLRFSNHLKVTLGKASSPLPARLLYHSGPVLSDQPTGARDTGLIVQLGS